MLAILVMTDLFQTTADLIATCSIFLNLLAVSFDHS